MERGPQEVRNYSVRGHVIGVFPSDPGQWGVTVDGVELRDRFSTSFEAWAAGAAESYRRDPGPEPRTLAAAASQAAARQHVDLPGTPHRRP
jgi:hypothetical protein